MARNKTWFVLSAKLGTSYLASFHHKLCCGNEATQDSAANVCFWRTQLLVFHKAVLQKANFMRIGWVQRPVLRGPFSTPQKSSWVWKGYSKWHSLGLVYTGGNRPMHPFHTTAIYSTLILPQTRPSCYKSYRVVCRRAVSSFQNLMLRSSSVTLFA